VVLILFIIVSFFVPLPWKVLFLVCGVIAEVGEVVWGRRLARRWSAKTGVEAMIGRRAQVVEACRPNGRVRIHGELWKAACAEGAEVGETVKVVAQRDLTLDVEPASRKLRRRSSQREDAAAAADRLS
jgi:membrane-bound serine protease (ClpP class)